MREIVGESNPAVLRLFPDRSRRRREVAVMEGADGNADMVWPQVDLPEHRRSACRAKMHPELSSFLPVADIDFGWPFGANMFLLEVGTNAEHRAGSPLALATVAGDYGIGIGGNFDTQGTTRAMRGSRHSTPPSSDYERLQESGPQSDTVTVDFASSMASSGSQSRAIAKERRTRHHDASVRCSLRTLAEHPKDHVLPLSARRSV